MGGNNFNVPVIEKVVKAISEARLPLHDEKELQLQIHNILRTGGYHFLKEFALDEANRPDFFDPVSGLAIEVKIKGSARGIFFQCTRYANFNQVRAILLITNRSLGFPPAINDKPTYIIKLGNAWL